MKRIVSVTTPAGVISYAYGSDQTGNLVTTTYPGPATRTYHYESSIATKLTGITDENGERFSTYTYDSAGKASGSEHAGGANKVTLVHDSSTGTRNIAVRRYVTASGFAERTYSFESIQAIGRKIGVSAAPGEPCPSCGPAAQTNDANANPSSKTDWNGNRIDYTYDLARNLETSRTEGLTSSGGTTPQTRTITTQWHPTFRLPDGVAEPLRITTLVYDPDGTACGARGALCSKSVQATSDADGSQAFSATPVGSGRSWTYTYNAAAACLR
jgi:YD repeat-containing protein